MFAMILLLYEVKKFFLDYRYCTQLQSGRWFFPLHTGRISLYFSIFSCAAKIAATHLIGRQCPPRAGGRSQH